VCSLSYPACKAHAPYYTVICDLPVPTIIFHIISQVERATEELKIHKSPGIDEIQAEFVKAEGRTVCPEIHRHINSILNKKELPE
jgi:hypothetical protein